MSLDVVKRYDELYTDDAPMKAKTSHEQALLDLAREIRLEVLEEAVKTCEEGAVQIVCTAIEAEGVVRRTRDALAGSIRSLKSDG